VNYGDPVTGQTGRLFLPVDFILGRKLTQNLVLSLEVSVPIIKDYPVRLQDRSQTKPVILMPCRKARYGHRRAINAICLRRYSNAKMRFQSFFVLITDQTFFFASS
jgi:hypothetical protein